MVERNWQTLTLWLRSWVYDIHHFVQQFSTTAKLKTRTLSAWFLFFNFYQQTTFRAEIRGISSSRTLLNLQKWNWSGNWSRILPGRCKSPNVSRDEDFKIPTEFQSATCDRFENEYQLMVESSKKSATKLCKWFFKFQRVLRQKAYDTLKVLEKNNSTRGNVPKT